VRHDFQLLGRAPHLEDRLVLRQKTVVLYALAPWLRNIVAAIIIRVPGVASGGLAFLAGCEAALVL